MLGLVFLQLAESIIVAGNTVPVSNRGLTCILKNCLATKKMQQLQELWELELAHLSFDWPLWVQSPTIMNPMTQMPAEVPLWLFPDFG